MKAVGNPSLNWSPLQRLATFVFHQDFHVIEVDVQTAVARHIAVLSTEQRQSLKEELTVFLANFPGKSDKGISRAWKKIGAGCRPEYRTTRELLEAIVKML
jgi:hypothetical protein